VLTLLYFSKLSKKREIW